MDELPNKNPKLEFSNIVYLEVDTEDTCLGDDNTISNLPNEEKLCKRQLSEVLWWCEPDSKKREAAEVSKAKLEGIKFRQLATVHKSRFYGLMGASEYNSSGLFSLNEACFYEA